MNFKLQTRMRCARVEKGSCEGCGPGSPIYTATVFVYWCSSNSVSSMFLISLFDHLFKAHALGRGKCFSGPAVSAIAETSMFFFSNYYACANRNQAINIQQATCFSKLMQPAIWTQC